MRKLLNHRQYYRLDKYQMRVFKDDSTSKLSVALEVSYAE